MKKRSPAPARIVAVAVLVLAFVVVVIAIGAALGGDSDESGGTDRATREKQDADAKPVPATYEVKSGDTLISIAHRMGITVAQIEQLNPEVDPQILVAGEQLKLR